MYIGISSIPLSSLPRYEYADSLIYLLLHQHQPEGSFFIYLKPRKIFSDMALSGYIWPHQAVWEEKYIFLF